MAGRRGIVLTFTFVLALGLAACGSRRSPVASVRALAEASREGQVEEVMRLIGPATRARLEESARLAAKQGARYEVRPRELLAVGWAQPRFRIEDVREIERRGKHARVLVSGRGGEREEVTAVKERDGWKIELP